MTNSAIDPVLREILRCPAPDHGTLRDAPVADPIDGDSELICESCGRAYPVRDGMPVMLIDEARPSVDG